MQRWSEEHRAFARIQGIQGIPVNVLREVMDNVRQRAEMCLTSNGAHLTDIILKK
jgi:hypothetical protein